MNENIAAAPEQGLKKTEYSISDHILSVFLMIAAYFLIKFTVFEKTGFFTTGVYAGIITAAVIYFSKKGFVFSLLNNVIVFILYAFSLVFSITDNSFIKFLDVIFLIFAGSYLLFSVGAGKTTIEKYLPFALKKSVLSYPFSKFGEQIKVSAGAVKGSKTCSSIKFIFLGLVATVPVTALVACLLMSADEGMENMFTSITDMLSDLNANEIMVKILLALPCSLYLFGMFWSNSHRDDLKALDDEYCRFRLMNKRVINNLICYTAVTPICLLYVLFFISQTKYFLSAFMGNLPEGFTYADYARRGFFELLWVAVINLGLICAISVYSKKTAEEKPFTLKLYSIILSSFTLILIATALSKMIMYIRMYGLTTLRVYTSWFMILLSMIFVLVIIKQFRFNLKAAKYFCIITTVMFALLCFSRPESLIARYNIEMYRAGYLEELDTTALLEMSDDGILTAYKMGAVTESDAAHNSNNFLWANGSKYNLSSMILANSLDIRNYT
ncbi:MAG: DUF4173 domain-containing protein [Oscillospiraceae bacterium]|nr:DUF4173 domain-containing protein [Oscillospiraceae bacterium]